jgi:tetratricopeptide (TPR) repeat protein
MTAIRVLVIVLAAAACVRRVETAPRLAAPPATTTAVTEPAPPLTPPDRTIQLPPVEIRSSPQQLALSDMDDATLFAAGSRAMAGGDNAKALLHFERLADFFPASTHRSTSLYNAGILLMKMRDWAGAVGRFTEAAKAYGPTTQEGLEARFRVADAYYFLGEVDASLSVLEQISLTVEAPPLKHAEANTKRAVCLLNVGRLDEAERILREVLDDTKDLGDAVRDGYLPSQAQFYLAEIYRQHFLEAKLDPAGSTQEQLLNDLEFKAQMLLSAQGHFLRCIRMGHAEWATASGFRIGELYQKLYDQMVDAPLPKDLDEDQRPVYLEELRNRVRVLVTKAVSIYEKTLATATRVGATNPFIAQTRDQLDRMKKLLEEKPAVAPSPTPAAARDPT